MFKIDMDSIREAAIEARLMANPANLANPAREEPRPLAKLATLATSQERDTNIDPVVTELLQAAMRACDYWRDGPEAREQMRRECLEKPEHLRQDLLQHFRKAYPP